MLVLQERHRDSKFVTMQTKQVTPIALIAGIFITFIAMVESNECEDKEQYKAGKGICSQLRPAEQNVEITAGIVTIILLVVVALLIFRKKKTLYPFGTDDIDKGNMPLLSKEMSKGVLEKPCKLIDKRMKQSDAEVWLEFHESLPEVYKLISENTFYFLYEVDKKYTIKECVYWKAYAIIDNSERAVFMINHFIEAGEEMCQGLLEMIRTRQDEQTHLQTLLDHAVKCSPTLNLNTAHKELRISDDRKTAMWSMNSLNMDQEPNHPDRFKYWTQVLSTESFSSGCHCWVVNVGKAENLCVGVTYQNIQRKEANSASLMGLNSTSWCLWKYENKCKAWHDKQSTELEVGEHPRRIGVGLDYDKGVLLFYNADNNTHLHTFYAHFSYPLHVALWVWKGVLTVEPVNSD